MKYGWMTGGLAALTLAACGGGNSAETETPATPLAEAPAATETEAPAADGPRVTPVPAGSLAGNPMILGPDDAPIKMIEYASVTCPGCASFHRLGWPFVKNMLVETGRVNFEYREFPTNPQNLAYAGFYLARCTATSNGPSAYFKILDTLYERQMEWAYGPEPGAILENIAAQAGIDRTGLEGCFFREDIKTAVADNVKTGVEDNVRGTPTFLLEGETFDWGASPLAMLHNVEMELNAKGADLIPVGASTSIEMPIDYCSDIFKNTERSLGGKAARETDTDTNKVMRVQSPDGGALVATCEAPSVNDPTTHTFMIAKVAQ